MAIFCCLILSALFSSALTQPVNDKLPYDLFNHHHLNDIYLELEETLGSLKPFGNLTELNRVRRQADPATIMGVIESGEKLANVFVVIREAFVNTFKSAIDELNKKIRNVNKSIADLSKEEAEKVPEALKILSEVETKFVIAKQQLISLAHTTLDRVNNLLIGLDGIHPGARRIDKRILIFLSDFELLLKRSTETLKDVGNNYQEMNKKLGEVNAILESFKLGIKARYEAKKNQMNTWIKHTREAVYGGCVASILIHPFMLPVCYATAAGVLETKIKEYKDSVARLEKLSDMTITELANLLGNSTSQKKYIDEELAIIETWKEKVKSNKDYFKILFDQKKVADDDILDFLDIRGGRGGINGGKEKTFETLCSLAIVAEGYLSRDQFIPDKYIEGNVTPEIDELCKRLECQKLPSKKADKAENIRDLKITDFELIGSLGGGLSAGTTYKNFSNNMIDLVNRKYNSHITGGSPGHFRHSSIFNLMNFFNKNLRASSTNIEDVGKIEDGNGLNFATFGATILDGDSQATMLIEALKKRGWESSWKMITVSFGLESLFLNRDVIELSHVMLYRSLLQKLKDLPRTLVLILSPIDPLDMDPYSPLIETSLLSLLKNPSESCKKELRENRKLFLDHLNAFANEFKSDDFAIEIIPAMKGLGRLLGNKHPDDDIQSKMGKFLWNNFISSSKSPNMDHENINCPENKVHLTSPGPRKSTNFKIVPPSMAIEFEIRKGTGSAIRIEFKNEHGHFKTNNMKTKGNKIKLNLSDCFETTSIPEKQGALDMFMKNKELSFRVESSRHHHSHLDKSLVISNIRIKGSSLYSFSGDVQNDGVWRELEKQQFAACSSN